MIEETRELTSTGSEINANILLRGGWTLLLISNRQNNGMQWTHFVFGWQFETPSPVLHFTGVEPNIEI